MAGACVSKAGNASWTCATNHAASVGPGSKARSLMPVTPSRTQAARAASRAGQRPYASSLILEPGAVAALRNLKAEIMMRSDNPALLFAMSLAQ
jgi:hypothetical protein